MYGLAQMHHCTVCIIQYFTLVENVVSIFGPLLYIEYHTLGLEPAKFESRSVTLPSSHQYYYLEAQSGFYCSSSLPSCRITRLPYQSRHYTTSPGIALPVPALRYQSRHCNTSPGIALPVPALHYQSRP